MMDLLSFPDNARIWIYAADREIPDDIAGTIHNSVVNFSREWSSHQKTLKATGGLLHNYFIVFVVDDGYNKPGGCSIDSSVRFIKSLGESLQVDFFKRTIFHYLENECVKSISKDDLQKAIDEDKINDKTLFFDTLVQTKLDFEKHWLKPLEKSWHRKLI